MLEIDPALRANNENLDNNTVEQAITPAQELGFNDGQFLVGRQDGAVEAGWNVERHEEVIDPKTGQPETAVFIEKTLMDEEGKWVTATKSVRLSELRELNSSQQEEELSVEGSAQHAAELATKKAVELYPVVESSNESSEKYTSREQQLFAPYVNTAKGAELSGPIDGSEFDYLFSDEDLPFRDVSEAAVKEAKGRGVPTESAEDFTTNEVLPRFSVTGDLKSSEVGKIISKHTNELMSSREVMEEIRNNPSLRLELGSLFMKRQQIYNDMLPERVAMNGKKSPKTPGYAELGELTSQEYVALLSLAKLDGTFDVDSSNTDNIEVSEGKVVVGQHRAASDMILFW